MLAAPFLLLVALQAAPADQAQGQPASGALPGPGSWMKPRAKDPKCISEALARQIAASGLGEELPDLLTVKFAVRTDGRLARFEIVEGHTSEAAAGAVWKALQSCGFEAGRDPQGTLTPIWVQLPIRFQAPPPPRKPTSAELATMGIIILGAFIALGWWVGRRLRLFGPAAPRRAELELPAYLIRKWTRVLFLFDFGFMFPAGVAVTIAGVQVGLPWWKWVPVASSVVTFGVPLVVLVLQIRRDHERRLAGLQPGPSFGDRYYGRPGVALHFRQTAWAPVATWLLILGCSLVAWWLPPPSVLERLLKSNAAVLDGQVWRLLTVALVHGDVRHLLANLSVLLPLGLLLDRLVGPRAFLLVFLGGSVVGSAASVIFIPADSVGASGGVLAMIGALATFGWRQRRTLPAMMRKMILWETLLTAALNLLLTFVLPFIDWAGHLGGLAAGLLLGWWLPPSPGFLKALASPEALPEPPAGAQTGVLPGAGLSPRAGLTARGR